MNQEKFVNQYIELLNATLSEAIQKNIVMQAQKRILEIESEEFARVVAKKEEEISLLKSELNESRKKEASVSSEREYLKINAQHVETFKNELLKTRADNDNLKLVIAEKDAEIESLKNDKNVVDTPSKNTWKKVPAKKNNKEVVKDAGKF